MAEGTFTLVDNRIFFPISHQDEKNEDSTLSNNKTSNNYNDSDSEDKSKINSHRKTLRRKISKKKINKKSKIKTSKLKRNKLFSTNKVKLEKKYHNGFEFCTTIDNNLDIKQEFPSDIEIKSLSESDDDIPLASLDKHSHSNIKNQLIQTEDITLNNYNLIEKDEIKNKIHCEERIQSFFCSKCNQFYETKREYRAHMQETHGKLYKCKFCLRSFDKQEDYEDHQNFHNGNRSYCCYVCDNALFKTENALKSHMKKYHSGQRIKEQKKLSCYICRKELSTSQSLKEHIRIHTGVKPIACKLCDKTFTRESDLRDHQNMHEELWKCKHCQKCFPSPFKLKEHVRSHTGELPYECDKCDRKFARVGDFRYHVGTHLGIKPYTCDECGMNFTTSSSVTRHRQNMHQSGPKMYECTRCSKKFYTQVRLNTHIRCHENKKKFKCEMCPAARNSLSELTKHMIIHGGQYRCDTCHRGFQNGQRLAAHTARHDIAGKPYACFVCSIGYNSSQGLNKHLATVHRNEDIPQIAPQHLCTLCGQVFELKDKLNRHLKENHIVIVVGEIHPIDSNEDRKSESLENIDNSVKKYTATVETEMMNETKNISTEKRDVVDGANEKLNNLSETTSNSIQSQSLINSEDNSAVSMVNVSGKINSISTLSVSEVASVSLVSKCSINTDESKVNTNLTEIENCEKLKLPINVQSVSKSIDNPKDSRVKDLSLTCSSNSISKPEKNSVIPNHKAYEEAAVTRSIPNVLVQDTNLLPSSNYRPFIDGQVQPQMINHISNPWFLPKPNNVLISPPSLTRSFYDSKQKYELRPPKYDSIPMHQSSDYRNVSENSNLSFSDHRNNIPVQYAVRNREVINEQKYYYETSNMRNLKDYYADINQRNYSEDRKKYNQQIQTPSNLSPRPIIHNYPNHVIPSRDYNTISARDLSTPTNMNIHNLHYSNHSFPTTPRFFHNFRDLQNRILRTHEYGNMRHTSSPAGMDMTNHHLNPSSPLSPYNQTSSHVLENMSPISRNSYEDSSSSQVSNSIMYGNQTANHSNTAPNGIEPNSNIGNNANGEQVNSERSYETRVGAI